MKRGTIDYAIWFKKFYCYKCGNLLEKRKITRELTEEEQKALVPPLTIPLANTTHEDIIYFECNNCGQKLESSEQVYINKLQKKSNKLIISDEEITESKQKQLDIAIKRVKKLRPLLLLPIIGALICIHFASTCALCMYDKTNFKYYLYVGSIWVLILSIVLAKLFIYYFAIGSLGTSILYLIAFLTYNIPTYIYITHKFKK